MGIGPKIEATFPGVDWTGGSDIHRSRCVSYKVNVPMNDHAGVMVALVHSQLFVHIAKSLYELFQGLDWQINTEEFNAMMIVDTHRHLNGQGDTQNPKKLKNPVTGNVFHHIATLDNVAGGIRIWFHSDGDSTILNYRFRLEEIKKDTGDIPKKARIKAVAAVTEAVQVMSQYAINEPSVTERTKARERVILPD